MGFSVWIIEASGKTDALKESLRHTGRVKDRVLSTFGRVFDLPDTLSIVTNQIASSPESIPWKELRPGQVGKLSQMCKGADEVFLATDSDLEGEVIASHIYPFIKNSAPCYRVHLSAITPDHIQAALKQKTVIDSNRVCAGLARRLFDRHLGYQLVHSSDQFAQSMGRVISPLIQSLVEQPPITTRIECALKDGWRAVFRLPSHMGNQAESLCGVLDSLPAFTPSAVSSEPISNQWKPLTGQEAILVSANKTNLSIPDIVKGLQDNYMRGQISYHRADSRRMGEISKKWAMRIAQASGRSFNPQILERLQSENVERSFDAHEAVMPLTERMARAQCDSEHLSQQDQILAALTEHCSHLGERAQELVLEKGGFSDEADAQRWKSMTRVFHKYLSFERVTNADGIPQIRLVDAIERKPDRNGKSISMWRDEPALVVAKRLVDLGLGRPSTIGIMAEKAAKTYLDGNAEVNGRGHLMLSKVKERCPELLAKGVARKVEDSLVSVAQNTLPSRLSNAWSHLRQPPISGDSNAIEIGGIDPSSDSPLSR